MAGRRNPIPVAPTRPAPTPPIKSTPLAAAPKPAPKPSSNLGTKSSSGSKSSGGGASKDPYAAYQKKQDAKEAEAKRKASQKYIRQAKNLEAQAAALQHALKIDFSKNLHQQLGDIGQILRQQQQLIREGYDDRLGQLKGARSDNEKAQASQSGINERNLIRERNSAVGEAMNQGAGESDVLAAQIMSLRNWQANQTEVQRGYFDTLRSINSSLTDLNVDTRTALANNAIQANADREQAWTNYHNQMSEGYTQLGNIRGQQADYYVSAAEMGGKTLGKDGGGKKDGGKNDGPKKGTVGGGAKKPALQAPKSGSLGGNKPALGRVAADQRPDNDGGRRALGGGFRPIAGFQGEQGKNGGRGGGVDRPGKQGSWIDRMFNPPKQGKKRGGFDPVAANNAKQANRQAEDAFMSASKQAGKSWDNPGVSDNIMDWEGHDDFAARNNNLNHLANAMTVKLDKVPEGATLRKWS